MCGRAYHTYTEEELELRFLTQKKKSTPLGKAVQPNYNLCPTQLTPIVLMKENEPQLEVMRFGLIPFWAKDPKDAAKYSLINAKSEEITEKRSYKSAFEHRQCIVPLTGFYEWHKSDAGTKQPFAIHSKKDLILSVAGVWEHWKSKDSPQEILSFSIITTSPNSTLSKIHNRMPVILDPKDEQTWLDPENHDIKSLQKLLKPCPSQWLEAYEISTRVNSQKNNSIENLQRSERR